MDLENYKKQLEERIKKPKPQSERAYWIKLTSDMLKVPFKTVLYKTINWKKEWIKDMYLTCNKVEEPRRLWWGLIKKSKNGISNS